MRRWAINLGLVAASVAVVVALFEGLLATGALDTVSIHWIPPHYKAADEAIMQPSDARMGRNPLGFNGPIPGAVKAGGVKARIMVLGDSFIWGFGLPYGQGLGRKLEVKVAEAAPGIEVLSFGRPGWSTLHQLRFLENEGAAFGMFEADFVLVAFGVNDLDLIDDVWRDYRKRIDWDNAVIRGLKKVIPNTTGFVTGHVDAAVELLTDDHGQGNWITRIWQEPNLGGYRKVLARLKATLDRAGVPFAIALVPANPNVEYYAPKFKLVATILTRLGIQHVDLLPAAVAAFRGQDPGRNYRRLWANPADSHPGDAMTTVLADAVVAYLGNAGVLGLLSALPAEPPTARFATLPPCATERRFTLEVARFFRYRLADEAPPGEGRPMLRVHGFGFEAADGTLKPLRDVYVLIGADYVPALPRLPLRVRLPDGRTITINGHFAIDVGAGEVREPALRELVGVTADGCVTFRPFGAAVGPKDAMPPVLTEPPMIGIGR